VEDNVKTFTANPKEIEFLILSIDHYLKVANIMAFRMCMYIETYKVDRKTMVWKLC